MMNSIKLYFINKEWLLVSILVLFFIIVRIPGTDLPLHQDEYKWPIIVNPATESTTSIPHPPLSQFIYRTAGEIVGFNVNFRFVPLFFGTINLLLLYYFVKFISSKRDAIIASLIWIFSYFSVLASLMVDTDGEIMPFFFLVSLIGYYKLKLGIGDRRKWFAVLCLGLVGGFFIKLSFLLSICAIIADFLLTQREKISNRDLIKYLGYAALTFVGLGIILILTTYVFPFFNLKQSVDYWKHFAVLDRNWFQTIIQCVKGLLYASPLLVLAPLFGNKSIWNKSRPLILFLIFAFIFYIVLFDFSLGALDRYLQLLILPLTVITALTLGQIFDDKSQNLKKYLIFGIFVSIILFLLQFLPHYVPPLHPKSEWINRFTSFKWNFLYPFTGGSGPLGFYVSFLFMALVWIYGVGMVIVSWFKPKIKFGLLLLLVIVGVFYNLVFIEEYLLGKINGNAPKLLKNAVSYIESNSDIKKVTVYNDNGGKEIKDIGKYRKRLYVDPRFDVEIKLQTLNEYKEHYFVLDVPRIDPNSIYAKYFSYCKNIYEEKDQKMSAIIYDCRGIKDVKQ